MKIVIDDNSIMTAALGKVSKGEYFDALTLFARVDSYESLLNQVGCLCQMQDIAYAQELYRILLSRYYYTHNCYADVARLGDATFVMLNYFAEDKADTVDGNKISANAAYLGEYPADYDDMDDIFNDPECLHFELEQDILDYGIKRDVYDVSTREYHVNLFQRMETAFLEENLPLGLELQQQFLSIDTNDILTLEMQMFLCWFQQLWEYGVIFALRYANLPEQNLRGMGACVHLLSHAGEEYQDELRHVLIQLLSYADELDVKAITELVNISSSMGYGKLTLLWTQLLYDRYKEAGCLALRQCAHTFYNCAHIDQARDAIITLLNAVPWDGVAATYLKYFNKHIGAKLDDITLTDIPRHYDIPTQLSSVAQYYLLSTMDEHNNELDSDCYPYIFCLYKLCLSCIIKGDIDRFFNEAEVLNSIIVDGIPRDKEQFFACAKQCMTAVFAEPVLSKEILYKMIELGYRDSVLLPVNNGFYTLDLSRLTVTDSLFVSALSICATLRKVDIRKLEKAYRLIKEYINDSLQDYELERSVAYALMAISYKRFAHSDASTYFTDDERELYEYYLRYN